MKKRLSAVLLALAVILTGCVGPAGPAEVEDVPLPDNIAPDLQAALLEKADEEYYSVAMWLAEPEGLADITQRLADQLGLELGDPQTPNAVAERDDEAELWETLWEMERDEKMRAISANNRLILAALTEALGESVPVYEHAAEPDAVGITYVSDFVPIIYARLTRAQIITAADVKGVIEIVLFENIPMPVPELPSGPVDETPGPEAEVQPTDGIALTLPFTQFKLSDITADLDNFVIEGRMQNAGPYTAVFGLEYSVQKAVENDEWVDFPFAEDRAPMWIMIAYELAPGGDNSAYAGERFTHWHFTQELTPGGYRIKKTVTLKDSDQTDVGTFDIYAGFYIVDK